ncbi:hypothetical protein OG474_31995 [Kribbella sp. NBC_01505]|uniref:hypothetical protein n=1 Tax=Kribbella sp. NBC_01505 TaxID=2903580 RepID=UPI00386CAB0F
MSWKFWKTGGALPTDPPTGTFGMTVEDRFTIRGRGLVVTGQVGSGRVAIGDQVRITRDGQLLLVSRVSGIKKFRDKPRVANVGDDIGLVLPRVKFDQVNIGDEVGK